jgi:hypothetical protein
VFAPAGAAPGATSPDVAGAGLQSAPLSRDRSLDSAARHTLSGVFDRLARLDPRDAIREATGWRPSFLDMVMLLMGCGLAVFALASAVMLLGGRDERAAA